MFNKEKFKIKLNYNHQFENNKNDLYKIYNTKLQHFDYFSKIAKNEDRSSNEFGKKIIYCKLQSIGKYLECLQHQYQTKEKKLHHQKNLFLIF